jgi:hypothetical protein
MSSDDYVICPDCGLSAKYDCRCGQDICPDCGGAIQEDSEKVLPAPVASGPSTVSGTKTHLISTQMGTVSALVRAGFQAPFHVDFTGSALPQWIARPPADTPFTCT